MEKHGSFVVIVIDNIPCHSVMEEILNEEEFIGSRVLRLSHYSPMFNPIENIWSILRSEEGRVGSGWLGKGEMGGAAWT